MSLLAPTLQAFLSEPADYVELAKKSLQRARLSLVGST
jgi:hypothetical protein